MSRCILIVTAALLLRAACAEEAIVQTRDGRTFERVISLRDNALTIINADRSLWVEIPATNLFSMLVKPRSPDPYLPRVYAAQSENDDELWSSQDVGWVATPGRGTSFIGLRRTFCTGTNIAGFNDSFHFT